MQPLSTAQGPLSIILNAPLSSTEGIGRHVPDCKNGSNISASAMVEYELHSLSNGSLTFS